MNLNELEAKAEGWRGEYGEQVTFMMLASWVAACAEMDRNCTYSGGEYWDKADRALTVLGDKAFGVGIELILLSDDDVRKTHIFIEWLRGQGYGVVASASNRERFREFVVSDKGESILRILETSVKLLVEMKEDRDLMFRSPYGYQKLTACAAALQLEGTGGKTGEICDLAKRWVRSERGKEMIEAYGTIPGFKDIGWYKRLVGVANEQEKDKSDEA